MHWFTPLTCLERLRWWKFSCRLVQCLNVVGLILAPDLLLDSFQHHCIPIVLILNVHF